MNKLSIFEYKNCNFGQTIWLLHSFFRNLNAKRQNGKVLEAQILSCSNCEYMFNE